MLNLRFMFPSPVIISPEQEDVYRRFKTLRDWFDLNMRHDASRRFVTLTDDSIMLVNIPDVSSCFKLFQD